MFIINCVYCKINSFVPGADYKRDERDITWRQLYSVLLPFQCHPRLERRYPEPELVYNENRHIRQSNYQQEFDKYVYFKIDEKQREKCDGKKVKDVDSERGPVQIPDYSVAFVKEGLSGIQQEDDGGAFIYSFGKCP